MKNKLLNTYLEFLQEVAPPDWEGTIKAMKKHKKIKSPWALAWYMKKKGYKPHYTKRGKKLSEFVGYGGAGSALRIIAECKEFAKEATLSQECTEKLQRIKECLEANMSACGSDGSCRQVLAEEISRLESLMEA
jgi:hypothetical protein